MYDINHMKIVSHFQVARVRQHFVDATIDMRHVNERGGVNREGSVTDTQFIDFRNDKKTSNIQELNDVLENKSIRVNYRFESTCHIPHQNQYPFD